MQPPITIIITITLKIWEANYYYSINASLLLVLLLQLLLVMV